MLYTGIFLAGKISDAMTRKYEKENRDRAREIEEEKERQREAEKRETERERASRRRQLKRNHTANKVIEVLDRLGVSGVFGDEIVCIEGRQLAGGMFIDVISKKDDDLQTVLACTVSISSPEMSEQFEVEILDVEEFVVGEWEIHLEKLLENSQSKKQGGAGGKDLTGSELRERVREREKEAKEKKIAEKAALIHGHMNADGKFADQKIEIEKKYSAIKIWSEHRAGRRLVFEGSITAAALIKKDKLVPKEGEFVREVFTEYKPGGLVLVESFIPGLWEEHFKRLAEKAGAMEHEKLEEEKRRREEEERKRWGL